MEQGNYVTNIKKKKYIERMFKLAKLLGRTMEGRTREKLETMQESEDGFRKGTYTDSILIIIQTVEKNICEKKVVCMYSLEEMFVE